MSRSRKRWTENIGLAKKIAQVYPYHFMQKKPKKQNELLANTIQRNKMEDFIKRICRFPGSYNFSFNNLVEERRKGILNKILPQEKKGIGKIYNLQRDKAKSLVNSGLES